MDEHTEQRAFHEALQAHLRPDGEHYRYGRREDVLGRLIGAGGLTALSRALVNQCRKTGLNAFSNPSLQRAWSRYANELEVLAREFEEEIADVD